MFCIAVALTSLSDGGVKFLWGLPVGVDENDAERYFCLEGNSGCGQSIISIDR